MSSDDKESMALLRYQVISPFLAEDPPRGQKYKMIERLADKGWPQPDGTSRMFSAETIRPLVDAVQDELATLPA